VSLISRLYDFVSQTRIKSSEVDNEFNQLVNAHNAQEASIIALEAEDILLQADIDAVNTKADNAVATANTANSTANAANTTSANAYMTASYAASEAQNAVNTANTANATAGNAVTTANGAVTTADGAVVIANAVKDDYETTEPILFQAVDDAEAAVAAVALKADVAYVDSVAASFVLGTIPDGSLGTVKFQQYSIVRLNKDVNGIYTEIQFIREDATMEAKSVLSGGTTPKYTTRTETYYQADGTTVRTTIVYALNYTGDDLTSEVIQ
jgi:hypothetical protein